MSDQPPADTTQPTAEEALLEEVRAAAEARLEAQANGDDSDGSARRALRAVHAALDGGHSVAAIAATEAVGERSARDRNSAVVLRSVERAAKKLREVTEEYERVITHAVRLGLPTRDIARRAGVSHGTVTAVARRREQSDTASPSVATREPTAGANTAEPALDSRAG